MDGISENPIEVYAKDEYDKMKGIERILDEKGDTLLGDTPIHIYTYE